MQEVEAMCNRVIIINKGNIVADNSMSELKEKVTSFRKTKKEHELSMEEVFHYLTKG
jgi:ABC-type multidrug transport system ATPase subunit